MNLGLVTSYIIGGILLLSILMMNRNVSQTTTELTMSTVTKNHVDVVKDILSHDIPKVGYRSEGIIYDRIIEADSNKFVFKGNIYNEDPEVIKQITWLFTEEPVTTTENPNDYILKRKEKNTSGSMENITGITTGVSQFQISYYSSDDKLTPMSTPVSAEKFQDIRQIEIKLVIEAPQKIYKNFSSDGRYVKSVWQKRFTPINLIKDN